MDINAKRHVFPLGLASDAWVAPSEMLECTVPCVAIRNYLDTIDLDNLSMDNFCIDVSMLLPGEFSLATLTRENRKPSEPMRLNIELNAFKERCKIMRLRVHRELAVAFTRLLFCKYSKSLKYPEDYWVNR